MRIQEIENAVDEMGAELLEVVYKPHRGLEVWRSFGRMGSYIIMWDDSGRGYVYSDDGNVFSDDGMMSTEKLNCLPYWRDSKFDLNL